MLGLGLDGAPWPKAAEQAPLYGSHGPRPEPFRHVALNGLIRSLNTRGLPTRIRDRTSANLSRLDYSYGYDQHGNITSIVDGVNANENRTLTYDARDRMSGAVAPNIYGQEVTEYDVLDNVRRLAGVPNGSGGYG